MRREDVEIDNPCEVPWEGMTGAGRQRHCTQCDREVANLSMMTEAEAEAFLEANHAPCVRYHLSAEGDILFQTPLERQRRGARRLMRAAAVVVPLLLGSAAAVTALQSNEADTSGPPPSRTARAELEAPDLVELLSDGDGTLSDALVDGYETGSWLASSAVGYVRDLVGAEAETREQTDTLGPFPDEKPRKSDRILQGW